MTIKEIAKLAGVSISTVSKIVNNKDQNINPETRSRVLQIVKEYNYTPYGNVKNTSTAKSFIIGILLQNGSRTNLILNGILCAAQKYGYSILLYDSKNSTETELKHITSLCKNNVDGIIWEPVSEESTQHEHYFEEQNIPIYYINGFSENSYYIDFVHMGYVLTQKLLDYKHTKIACLLKENSLRSALVLEGFKKCLYENQIPYNDTTELYISDKEYCSKIINNHISGIVSSHFASSLILYEQMEKLHYYIPFDLSLVSLRDDARECISFPRISSVKIPYLEFGYSICEALIKKCERKESHLDNYFAVPYVLDNEDSLKPPSFMRAKKLVVVGSINLDATFNVDRLPQAGKTTTIRKSTTTAGGKGANQSVGAAKLLREVSLIGETGNDVDATFLFDALEHENVNTQGVHRDLNAQTGKAYIYIENSGESAVTILPGANGNLSPEGIHKREYLFKNAGFCLLATEIPIETVIEAAKVAKKYGVKNILKPATLKFIPDILLSLTDILIPNHKEAAMLCPNYNSVEEQAEYFLNKGIETVIITLGEDGCYLKTAKTARYFPAADFLSIDTTGGADAFISAFASYLSEGYSLEQSIQIASYAAGFCISRQGVVPALVDKNTLETHISKLEPELLKRNK
ncbi:MAG: PfkB family carbohydrate kinase [Lachnospiraceae bacterium]|nr:PfkB family carbohydrate kinase [Lachnospiraceae bacterium]